jgi:hypothetical protein
MLTWAIFFEENLEQLGNNRIYSYVTRKGGLAVEV